MQNEALNEIYREAPALYNRPRQVAAYVASEVRRLEASGQPWVAELLAAVEVEGWMGRCRNWRSRWRKPAKTKRGRDCAVPAYSTATVTEPDGSIGYVQLSFDELTLEQLRGCRDRMAKTRNTLSVNLSVFDQAIDYMVANPECTRAGDALRAIEQAA